MSYNEWLDMDVLEDYLDGKLDSKTMHKVERISLEDPFVAEALAGLSQSRKRGQSLSLLQKQLQERVAQKPIEEKRWRITSHRLSIAAAAAVLFITVSILFWMRSSNNQQRLANQPKKVDIAIAPSIANKKISTDSLGSAVVALKASAVIRAKVDKSLRSQDTEVPMAADENAVVRVASAMTEAPKKAPSLSVAKVERADTAMFIVGNADAKRKAGQAPMTVILESKAAGISMGMDRFFTGRVYSQEGVPLPGASVRVSGRDIMTKTDGNGEFRVPADSVGKLTIGYSGFATQEVPAKSSRPMSVVLGNNAQSYLSEVAVSASVTSALIKGKIVDAKTGKALPNVLVRLATDKTVVVGTDTNGEFALQTKDVNASHQKIVVISIGYVFKEVEASTKQLNSIVMEPRPIDKDFRISIGAKPAIPVGGWDQWNEYIKANNKLVKGDPIGNVIILSFDVQNDGTPTAVKVDYGLGKAENAEATRLITSGPKWLVQPGPKRRMQIDIRF